MAVTKRITIFAIHYITELSHVGELREVREKLRDKCPTSYGKRLLSLNFSLTSLTSLKHYRHTSCCLCSHDECLLYIGSL